MTGFDGGSSFIQRRSAAAAAAAAVVDVLLDGGSASRPRKALFDRAAARRCAAETGKSTIKWEILVRKDSCRGYQNAIKTGKYIVLHSHIPFTGLCHVLRACKYNEFKCYFHCCIK